MNYIENIFICITAPLLIAVFCLRGSRKRMLLFLLAGMMACLLSSYISTFLAVVKGADNIAASVEIAPMVEETMKLFPVLFYLLIFEPAREEIAGSILMIAIGFATFENICFLTANGAAEFSQLLIRGFGTGAAHVVCGIIIAMGLLYLWERLWLRIAGTVGLLALAITYHAVYNLLISQHGIVSWIGFLIPIATIISNLVFGRNMLRKLRF